MKKTLGLFVATIVLAGFSTANALAADCVVHYKRTACAGQEEISYKKCGGEQECEKTKPAESKEECMEAALKSCDNKRFDITKWKVITATYGDEQLIGGHDEDGAPNPEGTNFCAGDRPDLNQCE
ncbi:MAG TPA: hypothetical protein PK513_04450 [Alphaproteobacteria bacterium]|nr:hypothetical protein [Alphaproteobacteria bacterium]USO05461.1 MAG: hypothetical protein H6859_10030 [Rhodospirillales bacterium]HOO81732.1 hypothetical protein [Alphaproteobacteria bacterium]